MATRSTIAVIMPDKTVQQVYCHWDGYVSHNGRILTESYNTFEAAAALVALGDISVLTGRITPIGPHSFDKPEDGTTIYYGRDRGETGCDVRVFRDIKVFSKECQEEEFNYLFDNGRWLVSEEGREYEEVEAVMAEDA